MLSSLRMGYLVVPCVIFQMSHDLVHRKRTFYKRTSENFKGSRLKWAKSQGEPDRIETEKKLVLSLFLKLSSLGLEITSNSA